MASAAFTPGILLTGWDVDGHRVHVFCPLGVTGDLIRAALRWRMTVVCESPNFVITREAIQAELAKEAAR